MAKKDSGAVDINPNTVARISKQIPDEEWQAMSRDEQIASVLTGANAVRAGDPVGKVCRNPETGEVAHRVEEDGLHRWRISPPDAPIYRNDESTLPGWDVLYEGGQ